MRDGFPLERVLPVAILGAAVVWLSTVPGVAVSPDGVVYLTAAESLAAGDGLAIPYGQRGPVHLTQFPPLYPLAIALLSSVGLDRLAAARALNSVCLATSLLLVALATWRFTRSAALACFAIVVTASCHHVLEVHSMALSEPLFLPLVLAGALGLQGSLVEPSGEARLSRAGLLLGLAAITRWAGLAFVAAGIATLPFAFRGHGRPTLPGTLRFVVASTLPLACVVALNVVSAGDATSRSLAFHPPSLEALWRGAVILADWIVPRVVPEWVRLVALATAFAIALVAREARPLGWLAFAYALFLVVARTFFDAAIPFDGRTLLPLPFLGVPAVCAGLHDFGRRRAFTGSVALTALLGVSVFAVVDGWNWLRYRRADWLYFNSPEVRESAVLTASRTLSPSAIVYSDGADILYFHTRRASSWLPELTSLTTAKTNARWCDEIRQARASGEPVYVVLLEGASFRRYFPGESEIASCVSLRRTWSLRDGSILELAPEENP